MKKYDYLIVGAGLYGAVMAYELGKKGKSCLVIDKRDHIAGDIYCEDVEGIHVHKYGAHIFHTSDKKIWDYINQFAEFNHYINSPVAVYKDELYNLPFNMNTFSRMWGIKTPEEAKKIIERQRKESGIGLFRSEFLYLENSDFPTEEQQFAVYKQVAENMAGKKVIIRTLDIGADKQVDYFNLAKEENPALGYRAIRICLTRPEIFKTQLRALYRASVYGNLSIMFPMIISVKEVRKIKEIIEEVKAELREEGLPFKEDVELGIMIETPASVMMSRELAKEVDFFSVGTNDLTQYTLAIDRQNLALDEFYDPHHPAVLAMIKMAADNAHAEGKWIGICGELGADLELTEEFLKMGLDELSVSPAMVLPLRKKIRECE